MWIELEQTEQSKKFRVLLKASSISSIEEAKNDSSSFKTKINFLDRTAIFVTNSYDEVKSKLPQ